MMWAMPNVVRFALSTARTLTVPGAGTFINGILDVDATKTQLLARTRYLVSPFRAVELGVTDATTPYPTLPATGPGDPDPDPYPQYLTDDAARAAFGSAADTAQALLLAREVTYIDLATPLGDQIAFTKNSGNPILEVSDTDLPTILWPWVVRVDSILDTPLGTYYMYFSTDHGGVNGKVALAYADDLTGPWTYHGVVYQDNTSGNETETPSVIFDAVADQFVMFHQQVGPVGAVAAQATLYATSPDGTTWTRGGIALDIPNATQWPAPAHTGYFRPFRVGDGWVAYSLLAGSSSPAFALSYSANGRIWDLDPRPLGWGAEWLSGEERIEWNTSNVVLWRGRYIWVGLISSFASGAETRTAYFAVAPLADDFRSFTGPPRQLFAATQAWETSYMQQGHLFVDDGRLVLVYRSGDGDTKPEAFGLATVEAA